MWQALFVWIAVLVLILVLLAIAIAMSHTPRHKDVWVGNIEQLTVNNTQFRSILHTGEHSQLVVMHLEPTQEIGMEKHDSVDQFIRVERGQGTVLLPEHGQRLIRENDAVFIPAGTWHNVVASPASPLKLYTLYAPPEHASKV